MAPDCTFKDIRCKSVLKWFHFIDFTSKKYVRHDVAVVKVGISTRHMEIKRCECVVRHPIIRVCASHFRDNAITKSLDVSLISCFDAFVFALFFNLFSQE